MSLTDLQGWYKSVLWPPGKLHEAARVHCVPWCCNRHELRSGECSATGRIYRIGSLHQSGIGASHHVAFYDELRTLGFIEAQSPIVDRAGYGLKLDELARHASVLIKSPIDVILCGGDVAIRAAQQVTNAVPIVAVTHDVVHNGFVQTLAKPAGNVTRISILATTTSREQARALQKLADTEGVKLLVHWVAQASEIVGAMEAAQRAQAQAIEVLATPLLFNKRHISLE